MWTACPTALVVCHFRLTQPTEDRPVVEGHRQPPQDAGSTMVVEFGLVDFGLVKAVYGRTLVRITFVI